jgi:hypothetical protein
LDFWDLTLLVFRRWKVALPLLLLAVSGTVGVALSVKPDYTMTSYVQLIPARVAKTDDPTGASLRNPWNQLGLSTLGQAAIYATQEQGFLESLKRNAHTDNLTLTMTYPNPIVTVEVVGKTPQDARVTTQLVTDRLQQSVLELQRGSGVGDGDLIASQRLDQGQNLLPSTGKVKRAIVAVAAVGLMLTVGGTVGLDALLRRRARRREERAEQAESAGEEAHSTPQPVVAGAGADPPELLPAAPARRADAVAHPPVVVPGNGVDKPLPAVDGAAVERTAIIIKRSASAAKAPPKLRRPAEPGTYRSANAQDKVNGTGGDDHQADTNGSAPADASDVRVVLQPKWVGDENGGEAK